VTNAFGSVTSSVATLTLYRAPVIVQQPTPTNVFRFAGANNTFFMTANAALPVSHYWWRDTTLVPTATGSNCVLVNLQTTNSGAYTVVVSNAFGMVTSSAALLTVAPTPSYPYGQAVLADHPIGYWRLDEINTTVAHDYLAGNNGVYTPD